MSEAIALVAYCLMAVGIIASLATCTVLTEQSRNQHDQFMWKACADKGGNWVSGWNGKWCEIPAQVKLP